MIMIGRKNNDPLKNMCEVRQIIQQYGVKDADMKNLR